MGRGGGGMKAERRNCARGLLTPPPADKAPRPLVLHLPASVAPCPLRSCLVQPAAAPEQWPLLHISLGDMSDSTNPPPPYRASPRIIMRPPPSRQPPVQHARSLPRFCARTLAAVGHGDRGHKSSARRVTFSSHDASPTTVETRFSQRMGSSTRTIVFVFRPVLKPGIRHATALPLRT